jgi:ribosomal protein L16 Arg81 hydroxylase
MADTPSTLAELVAPLTDQEFLALLRKRELAYRPGSSGDEYAGLVGWQALRRRFAAGDYPNKRRDDIRVTRESHSVGAEHWTTDGKVDVAKLDSFLAQGFSIVIVHVDEHVPALGAVCDEIKARTSEGSFVGVVVTSGTSNGAFKIHYDPEDLIILQVEGTKRWQIFGPPVANPVRGMPKQTPPESAPIFDEVLAPGDLLFVPAGNWHHCECGLSTSVHLGIFFQPPTAWHVMNEMIKPLMSDEVFRAPLTRVDGDPALEATEAEFKSRIIEKINGLKLQDFIAHWHKVAY